MKPSTILKRLRPQEFLYKEKVKVLAQLIDDPKGGHILDDRLVRWAREKGIRVELNCEDGGAWWNCRI